jgi:hypothetical protein
VGYSAEAMSPNDKYWQRRDSDAGRVAYVTQLGRAVLKGGGCFSNTYVPGTQTNGLCSFEALNTFQLPVEGGEVTHLQLASKVQSEGNVLLAKTKRGVFSIYLGEAVLTKADGTTFLASSDGFIGQINAMQGNWGCSHPESSTYINGRAFWFDMYTGSWVSYSNNGLFPISDYKLKTATRDFARKLQTLSVSDLEALNSRPFILAVLTRIMGSSSLFLPLLQRLWCRTWMTTAIPPCHIPTIFTTGKAKPGYMALTATAGWAHIPTNRKASPRWGTGYSPLRMAPFGNTMSM